MYLATNFQIYCLRMVPWLELISQGILVHVILIAQVRLKQRGVTKLLLRLIG